jgi:hypothetical protein
MSEYDGGDIGGHDDASYGDVNAGHEDFNLDHGHQAFGNEHDHLTDSQAYGNEHAAELDEHFAQGHHVESDTPASHFEESDFTNADVHASETDANFGEHALNTSDDSSFGNLDLLHEDGNLSHLSEHAFDGGGGEISAVSN